MPKVNQKVIAEKLDICRTTVSRCFSNHPRINPETRAKVLELAAQLGYRYSAPRTNKTNQELERIGVLVGTDSRKYSQPETAHTILEGISERAASSQIAIDLRFISPEELDAIHQEGKLTKWIVTSRERWKGAILIYPFSSPSIQALARQISCVSVTESYPGASLDCIDVDNSKGIEKLLEHLVSLNHRKIGFCSWSYSVESPWVYRRFGAFVESIYRQGLDFDHQFALNVKRREQLSIDEMADAVVAGINAGITAWVCAADHQAYPLMENLIRRGIRIPEDCSITGFDGILTPRYLPSLTTIEVPFYEMGVSAITRLAERMRNTSAQSRHNSVEGKFRCGDSTGIAPRR